MARTVSITALLVACSLLAGGCRLSLPEELVTLDGLDTCPDRELDELGRKSVEFDYHTDTSTLQCALGLLRSAAPAPVHHTAAGARIAFLLADRSSDDVERCERFAAEGVRWGEIALENGAQGDGLVHYYLAVNLGLSIREHAALAMKNLKRLKRELTLAHRLSPDEDQGGPGRVLGMLYLLAPPWPEGIGDGDKALELLNESVTRHPRHPLNHIFYARALWNVEEEDALDQVKKHLGTGRALLENGDWGYARPRWLGELQQAIEDTEIPVEELSAAEANEP